MSGISGGGSYKTTSFPALCFLASSASFCCRLLLFLFNNACFSRLFAAMISLSSGSVTIAQVLSFALKISKLPSHNATFFPLIGNSGNSFFALSSSSFFASFSILSISDFGSCLKSINNFCAARSTSKISCLRVSLLCVSCNAALATTKLSLARKSFS